MKIHALNKEERLKKGDFKNRRWQKKSETEHFILLTEKNDYYLLKRIGVVVRKRLGRAVKRNRMRRMVKEFYRLNKSLFFENSDHLIRIKKIPQNTEWKEISSELQTLLENKQNY